MNASMNTGLSSSRFLVICLLGLLGGCGDNGTGFECGPGTVEQDGVCVVEGDNGQAPTIMSIDPVDDLVGGGATFTLTGTGFRGGTNSVMFGDVPASFMVKSDSEITGTVPRGLTKHVDVKVTTRNGSASTAFTYVGLYAAQGTGLAGNLFLLDPRDGSALVIGPIKNTAGTAFAVTGMEFDTDGTLYATQATRDGSEGTANLLKIDSDTGAATVVGPLNDGGAVNYASIGDVTVAGGSLFGWAEKGTRAAGDDLVSINKTTGAVTIVGDSGLTTVGNAIVTLDNGTLWLTGRGAGPRTGVATTGLTHTINPTTGAPTDSVTLNGPGNAKVCATTRFRGTVFAMLCYSGHTLTRIDPANGMMTRLGSPPGGIDAIASDEPTASAARPPIAPPSAGAATTFASCDAGNAKVSSQGIDRPAVTAATLAVRDDRVVVRGRNGVTLASALGTNISSKIEIGSCDSSLVVPAVDLDRLVLVANKNGELKLVDRDGRTLLRGVTSLRAL